MPSLGATKEAADLRWKWAVLTSTFMDSPVQKQSGVLAALTDQTGVASEIIANANGVAWTNAAVNTWVMSHPGAYWAEKSPGQAPVRGSPTGGWALFVEGNELWVPESTVLDVPSVETPPDEGGGGMLLALGLGALVVLAGLLGGGVAVRRRRKKGK